MHSLVIALSLALGLSLAYAAIGYAFRPEKTHV